jgi:uncharacterized protein
MTTLLSPDSYHVFKYKDENLLFDVGTTMVCEINEFTYRFLELAQIHSKEDTFRILEEEDSSIDSGALEEVLQQFKDKGMFSAPCVTEAQEERLEILWRHKPRRLQLFMAQQCNLKCKYCYGENNESNQRQKLMTFEVAKQSVDYLIKRSGNRPNLQVTFFGGEPTLNFEGIRKVVSYCKEVGSDLGKEFVFELITNGTLLDKEKSDFLLDNDFLLFVSIDGSREMNNFQRPSVSGKDYYDTILKNALYLVQESRRRKSKHRVKIRANLTSEFHDVGAVSNYLESFGFRLIGIGSINSLPYAPDSTPMALTEEQQDEISLEMESMLLDILEKKKRGERVGAYGNRLFNKTFSTAARTRSTMGIICGIGRNTNAVDCDGSIYPCHRYVGMEPYIIGDVFNGLNREKTMSLYRGYNEAAISQCSACWARNYCAGGCPWEVSCPDGAVCKRLKSDCNRRLKGIERGLWLRKEARKHLPKYFSDAVDLEEVFSSWKWDCDA